MKTEIEIKRMLEEYQEQFDNVDSIENPEQTRYLSGWVCALRDVLEMD